MVTKFGNIVNHKTSIVNSFKDNFEKGIEIIKTEKELLESLTSKINSLKKIQANIEGTKKEIVTLLDEQPIEERKYYINSFLAEKLGQDYFVYLTYNVNNVNNGEGVSPSLTNVTVETMSSDEKDERNSMKNQFNELSRKYFSLQEKIYELEKLRKNLSSKSNNKYKLTLNELEQYGF